MSQPISVGNLLLDVGNYRIVKQDDQISARNAIIEEQGRKLVKLASDIVTVGISPIDLTLVIDAGDGNNNFIVIEGNRRLVALQLMLKPELAEGTEIHAAFKKLNKTYADSIPKVLECVIVPSKKAGLVWINRKHASGLEGAGTEAWSAIGKARADAEQGVARPELDAVNFVLTQPNLDAKVRHVLQGSGFNITTLQRLVEAKDVQDAIGFTLQDGKIITDQEKDRIAGIFTELATIIVNGKHGKEKFTERNVDTEEHRTTFLDKVLPNHPKKKKTGSHWEVSGKPKAAKLKGKKAKGKGTTSTDDQANLVPRKFKLELPAGKINDIFIELKELDVTRRRHAVSVLFRVFFEFTLDDFVKKRSIQLPKDNSGKTKDRLIDKLNAAIGNAKSTNLLSDKELKPIHVAISDKNSFLSPETLNAFVHSPWMNPDPMQLKLSWANCQLFVERLWTSK
jgi:hypothetical protein